MELRRPSSGYQVAIGLVAALMLFVALQSTAEFWRLGMPPLGILAVSLGSVAYGWLWWRSPAAAALLTLGALLAAFWGLAVGLEWADGIRQALEEWWDLQEKLRRLEFGATFGHAVGHALLVGLGLLSGLLVTRESFSRGTAFWPIVGGAVLFGTQWAWYFEKSVTFFIAFVFLALILWILGQAAQREAHWAAEGRRAISRSHIAAPVAAALLVTLLGASLPSHFEPVALGELGVRMQEALPVLRYMRGGGTRWGTGFSLATTGFSPGLSRLGGPVRIDERVALLVSAEDPIARTLYLRGAAYAEYTGSSWTHGVRKITAYDEYSWLPSGYPPSVPREYLILDVSPNISFGTTLFSPLEPLRVDGLKGEYAADSNLMLMADRPIGAGEVYRVRAQVPRYSADQIRRLSGAEPPAEFEPYMRLPESVTPRVLDLARRIAGDAGHPYDAAVAIESYLRGLTYDLDVPAAPPGRDFVDFFLFDLEGRGYCVYSATAMAVMLRAVGIPARLVEGFALPASTPPVQETEDRVVYPVRNSQAHAWVEAYFPGYGWVTFDPTPRADLPLIDRSLPAPASIADSPASPPDTAPPETPRRVKEVPEDFDQGGGEEAEHSRAGEWPWLLLLAVPALLAVLGVSRIQGQERFSSRDARSVVQEVWEKAAGLLGRFGFVRAPSLTPHEYALEIGRALPPLRDEALEAAAAYSLARYGPAANAVSPEDAARARSFWRRVKVELVRQYGWRTYLWRRMFGRRRRNRS